MLRFMRERYTVAGKYLSIILVKIVLHSVYFAVGFIKRLIQKM